LGAISKNPDCQVTFWTVLVESGKILVGRLTRAFCRHDENVNKRLRTCRVLRLTRVRDFNFGVFDPCFFQQCQQSFKARGGEFLKWQVGDSIEHLALHSRWMRHIPCLSHATACPNCSLISAEDKRGVSSRSCFECHEV
jgi:hypothetical protein